MGRAQLSTSVLRGGTKVQKWWFWLVSWAKWHGLDLTRCLKPPEIFFDPQGGPGGGLRGAAGGPNFRVYSSSITEGSEMLWYWARGLKFWKSPTWDWKKYNERKIFKKNWKYFFSNFFFSDFFLWSPKVGFSGKGPPIDFLRIFFRIFPEFFLKKSHLGLKKI